MGVGLNLSLVIGLRYFLAQRLGGRIFVFVLLSEPVLLGSSGVRKPR